MMMKRVISALVVIAAALCVQAQGVCVIKGRIASDTLRYDGQKIKKVYLTRLDEYNRLVNIDSTKVKKGKYSFQYKLAKDEPTMLYLITGFDNGNIPLFVEEGNVNITTASAAYPQGSEVSGTATNNLYAEYKKIYDACVQEQLDEVRSLAATRGEEWVNSDEGLEYRSQFNARSILKCNNRRLEFLLGHNASPLAPLMMNHELLKHIGNIYAMQLVGAIDPALHSHPYYRALKSEALAGDLREGNELPDIPLQMQDGSIIHLSDFRGKFVLIDFWAGWCNSCMQELKYIKQIYEETRANKDNFVLISHSFDKDAEAWHKVIADEGVGREGWIHSCDFMMGKSPTARLMNVSMIPTIVLIDPEGRAISFTLRGEEAVARVKQILSGDLYYLQGDKEE